MVANAFLGALLAGIVSGIGSFIAVRISLARQEQRMQDHINEDDRRFGRIERALGISGEGVAMFMTGAETRARLDQLADRLEDVRRMLQNGNTYKGEIGEEPT
jgi:hypothetical protein